MDSSVILTHSPTLKGAPHGLPSSKSISNRALLINALTGNRSIVRNLSAARDTKLMQALVNSPEKTIDVMDAGTTMRFLTAYFAITNQQKILTGTDRMKQRPIGLLVEALRKIGAIIEYQAISGYPPIEIKGFSIQKEYLIEMPGHVSSQYISALMMVAPTLPKGLTIKLTGHLASIPYIEMTAALMREFGADVTLDLKKQHISIKPISYKTASLIVEADWSAASYWFAFVALATEAQIVLPNVTEKSLQGDRVIVELMEKIGVHGKFRGNSIELIKIKNAGHLEWNFTHCPDLAQTVLPVCAAKGITGNFTGLESLRIKETDRIAALQNELKKIGSELTEPQPGLWKLVPGKISSLNSPVETYHDHRMAMGFAPWATLTDITIQSPDVVNKSYPAFWDDVRSVGIQARL
ncbi:MAG: 3-phosphoshikimate 1-carboxyvinyltransferase [Cytophagales bacterium]|nr:3-phosphoshikimate 1-carboxyvinyltransferase [Bacteroidota bacterium]MBS1981045.1 3-phosphoshikimate 1-carboxyvinyltransferase [Bacteroidota bacterium]WHZ08407.1 MAG: 3-phosphoshikimate 1-carboxyvinyltransferase [Cytophagales bacterium]